MLVEWDSTRTDDRSITRRYWHSMRSSQLAGAGREHRQHFRCCSLAWQLLTSGEGGRAEERTQRGGHTRPTLRAAARTGSRQHLIIASRTNTLFAKPQPHEPKPSFTRPHAKARSLLASAANKTHWVRRRPSYLGCEGIGPGCDAIAIEAWVRAVAFLPPHFSKLAQQRLRDRRPPSRFSPRLVGGRPALARQRHRRRAAHVQAGAGNPPRPESDPVGGPRRCGNGASPADSEYTRRVRDRGPGPHAGRPSLRNPPGRRIRAGTRAGGITKPGQDLERAGPGRTGDTGRDGAAPGRRRRRRRLWSVPRGAVTRAGRGRRRPA
jgi:hypothetical protein